jgi:hypothetical protein
MVDGHWTFTCESSPEFTLRDARAALAAHVAGSLAH